MFEELLADKENTIATHNEKIMIARAVIEPGAGLLNQFEQLIAMARERNSTLMIINKMKEIVPEFESNNLHFKEN